MMRKARWRHITTAHSSRLQCEDHPLEGFLLYYFKVSGIAHGQRAWPEKGNLYYFKGNGEATRLPLNWILS